MNNILRMCLTMLEPSVHMKTLEAEDLSRALCSHLILSSFSAHFQKLNTEKQTKGNIPKWGHHSLTAFTPMKVKITLPVLLCVCVCKLCQLCLSLSLAHCAV